MAEVSEAGLFMTRYNDIIIRKKTLLMATEKPRDRVFADTRDIVDFKFDAQVARVFPDMIRRSVPGYDDIISLLGLFAERYVTPGSRVYDLGCSLGAASLALHRRIRQPGCTLIAVDNARDMIERARQNLPLQDPRTPIELLCEDIRSIAVENASLVVMNFTLQFIPAEEREALLAGIFAGLRPGGALVVSEKFAAEDPAGQDFQTAMHLHFKRANGYSDLEISQKRTALENVLIPESFATHKARLENLGFRDIRQWHQCFNFGSLVAVKS